MVMPVPTDGLTTPTELVEGDAAEVARIILMTVLVAHFAQHLSSVVNILQ